MVFHISDQMGEALPLMMTGAAVMYTAERPLNRVGTRIVGWHPESSKPWMGGQPQAHMRNDFPTSRGPMVHYASLPVRDRWRDLTVNYRKAET
jgi:hypothetical protein